MSRVGVWNMLSLPVMSKVMTTWDSALTTFELERISVRTSAKEATHKTYLVKGSLVVRNSNTPDGNYRVVVAFGMLSAAVAYEPRISIRI